VSKPAFRYPLDPETKALMVRAAAARSLLRAKRHGQVDHELLLAAVVWPKREELRRAA
jgi:hypothetical protein